MYVCMLTTVCAVHVPWAMGHAQSSSLSGFEVKLTVMVIVKSGLK